LYNYRKSHTWHDDDLQRLKAYIATKGIFVDDLPGNLDDLEKVTKCLETSQTGIIRDLDIC